jgi:hypothetical protein
MTVTPFRAGNLPGEQPAGAPGVTVHPAALIPGVVLMADISEFQPSVADAKYAAWSQAVIIRAAYGSQHDDRAWYGGARRDAFHAAGIRFLGIYQYVIAGQDIAGQAREFARLVGKPRAGEFYIADIEEGGGNLSGRWQAWQDTVTGILGAVPLADYSGRYFARDHGLQPVDWIASYGTAEPPETHLLWQFTDAMTIPGIPGTCDCSVFHGSIDDLAAHAYGGQPPSDWTEQMIMALPTLAQGDTDQPGAARLVHRVQLLVTGIGDWNNLGPATQLTADGSYGPKTAAGVKAVQGYFGLSQDGTCGQATWHHLVTGG